MAINTLLEQAKHTCQMRGARFTIAREQVFKILAEHEGAIGAYDLLDQLKKIDPFQSWWCLCTQITMVVS